MNNYNIFNSNEFGKMRTYRDPKSGEVWFNLNDICNALGIKNVIDVKSDLPKGVTTTYPLSTNGRTQNATFVNESGLYNVIFSSKSPKAIPFRKWLWSEVLFKDTVKGLLDKPNFMIKILEKLKAEKEENKRLQKIIDENKPKVDFANAALESVGSALTKELALWLQKDNRKDQH